MVKVVVVTGIPGSGKSTVSRRLAATRSRVVLISGDELRGMVVAGRRDPNDPWDDETRSQYYLSFENAASLTRTFLLHGFDVVIDDVIRRGELYDEWLRRFEGIEHRVVLLRPSRTVALQRNRDRSDKTVPESTLHELDRLYDDVDSDDWIVVDNGAQTVEATVSEIIRRLD